MLDAAANAERLDLLRELRYKRRLFMGLGLELIVVETAGPADAAIPRLDAHTAAFLRDAVVRRYTPR